MNIIQDFWRYLRLYGCSTFHWNHFLRFSRQTHIWKLISLFWNYNYYFVYIVIFYYKNIHTYKKKLLLKICTFWKYKNVYFKIKFVYDIILLCGVPNFIIRYGMNETPWSVCIRYSSYSTNICQVANIPFPRVTTRGFIEYLSSSQICRFHDSYTRRTFL